MPRYDQIGFGLGQVETGGTPFENALLGLLTGFNAFIQAKTLSEQTQAEMSLRRQKLSDEMDQARMVHEEKMGDQATRSGIAGQESADRRYGIDQTGLRQTANIELEQGNLNSRQEANQAFQKDFLFPQQEKLAGLRAQGSGSAETNQEGIDRRNSLQRAQHMVDKLIESGDLDPNDQQAYQEALQFYSLSPQEQQVYLEERATQQGQEQQNRLDEGMPGMHQQAIGAVGRDKEVLGRSRMLEQQGGGDVRFEDLYGSPTSAPLIGGKFGTEDQTPLPFMFPPDAQGETLRPDQKKGGYQMNMEPLHKALRFLNSSAPHKPRPKPASTPWTPAWPRRGE